MSEPTRQMSTEEMQGLLTGYDASAIDHMGAAVQILRESSVDFNTMRDILLAVYQNQTQGEAPARPVPDTVTAYDALLALMKKHDDYGARDSEGWSAVRWVEEAAHEGKPFPLVVKEWPHDNPFELYESVVGWQTASAELVQAAEVYWKSLVQTRLKITVL